MKVDEGERDGVASWIRSGARSEFGPFALVIEAFPNIFCICLFEFRQNSKRTETRPPFWLLFVNHDETSCQYHAHLNTAFSYSG